MKTVYQTPEIEIIRLDNQISLILTSAPPEGPDEGLGFVSDTFSQQNMV